MTAISNANLPVSNGSGDAALAHVQSTRVIGSTTIATDTIANWPSFFIATTGTLLANGFIDPTSKTDFYGHLGVGNQLIIDGYCPGNTDNGNTAGQVVVIKPNTEWANLIAQGVQGTSLFPSQIPNFVEPAGGVWSISSGLVGVQTVGNVWYQGIRYSIPAVATLTFTASKDTYVDVNPATGIYTYVPVANLAAEPAITASCVRVAKIVTSASAITNIIQSSYNTPLAVRNLTNSVAFSVYRAAALTYGSPAVVPFDTAVFDNGSNVDLVTNKGRFTAPVPGKYWFNAGFGANASGSGYEALLYKNGVSIRNGGSYIQASAWQQMFLLSGLFSLAAGDYIEGAFYGSGTAATVGQSTLYFEGLLVSK